MAFSVIYLFREPWSLLLYHDRFPELREEMKELLGQANQPGEQSLREKVGTYSRVGGPGTSWRQVEITNSFFKYLKKIVILGRSLSRTFQIIFNVHLDLSVQEYDMDNPYVIKNCWVRE